MLLVLIRIVLTQLQESRKGSFGTDEIIHGANTKCHFYRPAVSRKSWARSCENVSYAICEQQRRRSYPRSLISTFVVRCLDSMTYILAISKVSRF